jgi:16S rRNA (uracil1498-N3)-methyltransferase
VTFCRCFVPPVRLDDDVIELGREEAHHLATVLRAKPGMHVLLFDGQGRRRDGVVQVVGRRQVTVAGSAAVVSIPPPACRLHLYACVAKGKRMDWLVEKATELGAARIVPVISEHTVARPAADDEGPVARWRRIALAAARQCGTAWLPHIERVTSFVAALSGPLSHDVVLAGLLTDDALPLRSVLDSLEAPPPADVALWIGPEGDFTEAEADALLATGARAVSLGPRVLRAETAALFGLSVLACEWGV